MDWSTIIITVLGILGTFIGTGLSWLIAKAVKKWNLTDKQGSILESLAVAVDKVYNQAVRQAKKDNSKGKLSDDQRSAYRSMAINFVKEDLVGGALGLFNSFSDAKKDKLVESAVIKAKKK